MKYNNIQYLTVFVLISQLWGQLLAATIDPQVPDEIANTGTAQVIISLYDPVPLDTPSASSCESPFEEAQTADNCTIGRVEAVALAQQYVLNELPVGSLSLKHRYSHVSALAGTITQAALDILATHPQVFSVYLDDIETVQLAESVPLIRADSVSQLNPISFTGQGITIAVLDTGIDADHLDLADSIVGQHCFTNAACPPTNTANESDSAEDDEGHGTHVAGIITSNGSIAPKGIAPDAKIVAVKVCGSNGCYPSDATAGLNWIYANLATQSVQIVNMSIAGNFYLNICDTSDQARADAVNLLVTAGVTVFAASGNNGSEEYIGKPACIKNVIAVGATYDGDEGSQTWGACTDASTATDQIGCFSNSNILVDLLAPGAMITSSYIGGVLNTTGGTSQASPTAAGVAALMLEANPSLTATEIKTALQNTGVSITDTRNSLVFPRIDACNAVNTILPNTLPNTLQFSSPTYTVNENGGLVTVEVTRTGANCAIAVDYVILDGSAIAGSDYTGISSGTLTWNHGDPTNKTFTVSIQDDSDLEGSENFTVTLSNPSGGASLGTPSLATVTITDDEIPTSPGNLQFSTPNYSVNENGASSTITVTRTNGSTGEVSVTYATSDGSAIAGSDYTGISSGTLTWNHGDPTNKTFTVSIQDDSDLEGSENFTVTLSNPTGGANIGLPQIATLVIQDDEIPVSSSPRGMEPLPRTMMVFVEIDGSGVGTVQTQARSFPKKELIRTQKGIQCQTTHCQKVSLKKDSTGMICERDFCAHHFKTPNYVDLIPTPAPGSIFTGWGGHKDCVDGQLWMTGNRLCIAYFRALPESILP
jgi:subtilisin family serine protease